MGQFIKITPFGRTLVDNANAADARADLELGSAATQNSSAFDPSGSAAAALATALAASQPLDSDLTAIAALSTTAFGRALLTLLDAAAGRTALGLGTLATQNGTFSGTSSGTNTGDQDLSGYATTAAVAVGYQPLDGDLTALAALSGTNTIYYRSAANTWTAVTIGSGLSFTSGTLATTGGSGVALGDSPTWTGSHTWSKNSVASTPTGQFTGTWFSGGTSTTTKPHVLIESSGVTSNNWSTSGTGLGVNAPSGFVGNLADFQVDGVSKVRVKSDGTIHVANSGGLACDNGSGIVLSPVGGHGGILGCHINSTLFGIFTNYGTTTTAIDYSGHITSVLVNDGVGHTINGSASQTAPLIRLGGESSTTSGRAQAEVDTAWNDSTDATRSADLILRSYYTTTAREGIRIRGGSSNVQLGFYGITPVSRQTLATGSGATVDDVITALQNLGLVKQS